MANLRDSDSEQLARIERLVEGLVVTVEQIARDQAEMKADIAAMKVEQAEMKAEQAEMKADIAAIKAEQAEMKAEQAEMKADIAAMKGEQAEMKADIAALKVEQSEMKAEQVEMKADIAAMKGEQVQMRADIDRLSQGYDRLSRGYDRLSQDVGIMKGWQTELAVERRADRVFRQLCGGGRLLRIYPEGELRHYVGEARNAGNMTEQEFDQARSVDFLLEGTDRNGAAAMFTVEVSFSLGVDDSDRAIGKAALLTRVLGREVRPGVAGESPAAGFEDDARERGVAYAYISDGRGVVR